MAGSDLSSLILRNAAAVWVGPPGDRHLEYGVDLEVCGTTVASIGADRGDGAAAREIDASGWLVLPGFVNAHHHLSQQLTRTRAVGGSLIDWLTELYPVWAAMDAEASYAAARVGIAELLRSGVTTVSDFTYYYPRGEAEMFDAEVRAAAELGCRFHPVRGGLAEFEGAVRERLGDAIDETVESSEMLLAEIERVVAAHHDPEPGSMCRVGIGLTEKAYGDPELMIELAALADRLDLRLHTHLHPRDDERERARSGGKGAVEYLRETGWWNDRLWVAHGSRLLPEELDLMARDRVGLCTCPSSNARFGMPIAPAWDLHRRGGTVAVGVDGAASNDGGDFVSECRLTWQVQRIRSGTDPDEGTRPTIADVLEWGTAGGASVLGRPELGSLTEGGLADLACFDLSGLDYVGADSPLEALLLCGVGTAADLVLVGGEPVVEDGHLVKADEAEIAAAARRATARLAERADA